MNELSATTPVAVLGCGLMGSGIARALAGSRIDVSVWNRTTSKAQALAVHPHITAGESAADACDEASVVISVLEGYDALQSVLDEVPDLSGKTVVNLTTGSRTEAAQMQRWVQGRRSRYLEGIVLCYPQNIGKPEGLLVYSGDQAVYDEQSSLLAILGGNTRYVSAEIGAANISAAGSAFLIAALTACAESVPFLSSFGIGSDHIKAITQSLIETMPTQVPDLIDAIQTSDYSTDQANVDAYLEATRTFRSQMQELGFGAVVLEATERVLTKAHEVGLGSLAMASVAKLDETKDISQF